MTEASKIALPHLSAPCDVEVKPDHIHLIERMAYGYEIMFETLCHIAGTSGEGQSWYTGKAQRTTSRISPLHSISIDSNKPVYGDCKKQYSDFMGRILSCVVTKPVDGAELSGISGQLKSIDAVAGLDDNLIKELEDAIAWRKLPNQENHKSTLRLLERALSAILPSRGAHRTATELDLSNLIRHAFISGFEAMGGTITDAINNWPVYDYERCPSYGVIARALSPAEPAQGKPVDVATLTPAEAVYGLLGWLTSRNETVSLGSSHGAAIGAELAAEFCKENNLGDCRNSFPENLKHPTITAIQPVDVAVVREQCAKLCDQSAAISIERIAKETLPHVQATIAGEFATAKFLAKQIRALSAAPAQAEKYIKIGEQSRFRKRSSPLVDWSDWSCWSYAEATAESRKLFQVETRPIYALSAALTLEASND